MNFMANKKIVVLKLRELIYTGIFLFFGIVLILLLIAMFSGGHRNDPDSSEENTQSAPVTDNATAATFRPGLYTTDLTLAGNTVSLQLLVDADQVVSIDLESADYITTMYPLMEPCMETLARQICENQSVENLTYPEENQYTARLLTEAVSAALQKAKLPDTP